MKLKISELANTQVWEDAGIALPHFDIQAAADVARHSPVWIHMGAGNIFRAFPAAVWQKLLESGDVTAGLVAVGGNDNELIDALRVTDNLSLLVTLKGDGSVEKSVIASIVESLKPDVDYARLCQLFCADSLQMVSYTITEKGYSLVGADGALLPAVSQDFVSGPDAPTSYMGITAGLLYHRYKAGGAPLSLVSMDNCSKNGDRLRESVLAYAEAWREKCGDGFVDYINAKVAFPWTMIDKITPRPDTSVAQLLRDCGFDDVDGMETSRHTFIAPFVNAEETEWLVIEDSFPNGRPPLEKGGIIFTDRDTVSMVEKMKVCTCLNPLHTALAIFGCLLGYEKISDEMKDADLVRLIETVGYVEGLPVVTNPGIIEPRAFLDNVINERLPNPFMPDTPQRIACDTSQKLPIRFGETLKNYIKSPSLDAGELRALPLVYAGWLRYLRGVDDNGKAFEPSPDPLLSELQARSVPDIMHDKTLFGVDLYEAKIADKVLELYNSMEPKGGVRAALQSL